MAYRLLMLAEKPACAEELLPIFYSLQLEVMQVACEDINHRSIPPCAVAIIQTSPKQLEQVLTTLRQRRIASKLLVLAPFGMNKLETYAVRLGADDVLTLPVTRCKLELTVRNLLRLYELEQSCYENED